MLLPQALDLLCRQPARLCDAELLQRLSRRFGVRILHALIVTWPRVDCVFPQVCSA